MEVKVSVPESREKEQAGAAQLSGKSFGIRQTLV